MLFQAAIDHPGGGESVFWVEVVEVLLADGARGAIDGKAEIFRGGSLRHLPVLVLSRPLSLGKISLQWKMIYLRGYPRRFEEVALMFFRKFLHFSGMDHRQQIVFIFSKPILNADRRGLAWS